MSSSPRLITVPFVLVTVAVFLGAMSPNLSLLASRYLDLRGYTPDQIGLVMGSFAVGSLPTMLAVGRIIQRGRRSLVLAAGCLVGGTGCVLFELAGSVPGFAAARVVQGAGFAAVLVSGSAYVAEQAPVERLAEALGLAGVLTLASQAVAPALGELLVGEVGWPWLFRAGLIAGGIGAVTAAFLPGLPPAEPADPTAARVSARQPLVAMFLAGFGFGAVFSFIAAYAPRAGVMRVAPFFGAYVAAAISTRLTLGRLADVYGRRAVAVPALVSHSLALVALTAFGAMWQLVAIGVVYGLSHGVYYPALQAMVVDRAAPDARSRAVASTNLAFGGGVFAATWALGYVADLAGYPVIYAIAACMGAVAAGTVWSDGAS